jgi:hypothetical protein
VYADLVPAQLRHPERSEGPYTSWLITLNVLCQTSWVRSLAICAARDNNAI